MRRLLTSETLIASALLLFLGWVGVGIVSSSSAIASLQVQQQSSERSERLIDDMARFVPRLDERLNTIEKELSRNTAMINNIGVVQSKQNAKLYCLYSYPVKKDALIGIDDLNADIRTKCVGTMLNVGGN
jgi:hypothetical protein